MPAALFFGSFFEGVTGQHRSALEVSEWPIGCLALNPESSPKKDVSSVDVSDAPDANHRFRHRILVAMLPYEGEPDFHLNQAGSDERLKCHRFF